MVHCIKQSCDWLIRKKILIRKLFIISLGKKGKWRILRTYGSVLFRTSNAYLKLKIALLVGDFLAIESMSGLFIFKYGSVEQLIPSLLDFQRASIN